MSLHELILVPSREVAIASGVTPKCFVVMIVGGVIEYFVMDLVVGAMCAISVTTLLGSVMLVTMYLCNGVNTLWICAHL